jgi:predicted nucleic acid-binding protein
VGLIYLDSCLPIYLVEHHPTLGEAVASAMAHAEEARFGISPLVKCECLVVAFKRGDAVLQRAYSELFGQFVSLDMPEPDYIRAAELRARFGLRTPDALHLACSEHHHCDELWTNDERLTQAAPFLARRIAAT